MRVTNKLARADIETYRYHSETKKTVSPLIRTRYEYATDLLESRELIKEMREQLSAVVSTASTPTTKGESVYINNYIEMRELLEKTKEYAE